MNEEQICYNCKHVRNEGTFCPLYKCALNGEKRESYDSCPEWEDYEDD